MRSKLWSEEDDSYLRDNYFTGNMNDMMAFLNRTEYAIIDRATKKLKLHRDRTFYSNKTRARKRAISFNEHYFDKITDQNRAYWYGFLWADGCISDIGRLGIHLSKVDIDVLSAFLKAINSDQKISIEKTSCRISVCCGKDGIMKHALNSLNILPRKTYLTNIPLIDDEFFPGFLLGIFDGDGCIMKSSMTITNTKPTCEFIRDKLKKLYGISSTVDNVKDKHAHRVRIHRKSQLNFLYNLFYNKNATDFYLTRKKNRFVEFGYCGFNYMTNHDGHVI